MDTREKLLVAAEECLMKIGHRSTTVKEISKRAGVNHGLVHHYFGSKEQLYVELLKYSNCGNSEKSKIESPEDLYRFFMEELLPNARMIIEFNSMAQEMPEVSKALATHLKQKRKDITIRLGTEDEKIASLIMASITGLVLNFSLDKTIPIREAIYMIFNESVKYANQTSMIKTTLK